MTTGGMRTGSEGLPASAVVVGLGETGLSCTRHLRSRGLRLTVVDSRPIPPGLEAVRREHPEVGLHLGSFPPDLLRGAETLIVSPGVSIATPVIASARSAGVPAWGDIELFARAAAAPCASITGSNGKSTVTTMVGEMARRAGRAVHVGGNLGPPALTLLEASRPDLYVLELSSFQLETTHSFAPEVAAVLNVSADHMDRYADLAAYAAAKARIFTGARTGVVNLDDPLVPAMAAGVPRRIGFTLGAPGNDDTGLREHAGEPWICVGRERLLPVSELRVPGRHNVANALAATAIGLALDLPHDAMCAALRVFPGLPHRCQLIAEHAGVNWYNDSKGTNVGATAAAIDGIGPERPVILIAGGDGKGADFTLLREPVSRFGRAVILLGRDAPLVEAALGDAAPIRRAATLDEAVAIAGAAAHAGDAVLFSPACASFDMFESYVARGEAFEAAARGWMAR